MPFEPLDSTPSNGSRSLVYAGWAALLSQGSPVGALALGWFVDRSPPLAQLTEHGLLYAYLSLATLAAFGGFGYALGRMADELTRQEKHLRHANRRLRWLSEVDTLTGVLNRRAIRKRLQAELRGAQREGGTTALILLDLDHFKEINDRSGHVAGDLVLRRVGRYLRRSARATDSVGRIGGDEFLLVLPGTSLGEAGRFAERLGRAIAHPPDTLQVPPVTASFGVTARPGAEPLDVQRALQDVDSAMYRAKAEGRDRVCTSPTPSS